MSLYPSDQLYYKDKDSNLAVLAYTWITAITFDTTVFGLTAYKAYKLGLRIPVVRILFRDGALSSPSYRCIPPNTSNVLSQAPYTLCEHYLAEPSRGRTFNSQGHTICRVLLLLNLLNLFPNIVRGLKGLCEAIL